MIYVDSKNMGILLAQLKMHEMELDNNLSISVSCDLPIARKYLELYKKLIRDIELLNDLMDKDVKCVEAKVKAFAAADQKLAKTTSGSIVHALSSAAATAAAAVNKT